MTSLPSHRQLLTNLVTSLSRAPLSAPASPSRAAHLDAPPDGPSDRRHLLLTLHVVFPNLLLPALDLLDRGLVTRITCGTPRQLGEDKDGYEKEEAYHEPESSNANTVFVARSLASTITRRKRDMASVSKSYIVRLDSWNCSCAGFTLDAFPPDSTLSSSRTPSDIVRTRDALNWSFGGLSLDGLAAAGAEDVPCCKHLLACLLAMRWDTVLGTRVESRQVSKEELAGIVAGL